MSDDHFDPPSDFNEESDSSGGRNIWKWLGIGCLVILLLAGIAFAFGAWQTVSCCQEAIQAHNQTRQLSVTYAQHLQAGEYEEAWGLMTPRYQDARSFVDFRDRVAEWEEELAGTSVRVSDVRQKSQGNDTRMMATVQFAAPTAEQKVVMELEFARLGGSEETPKFGVDGLKFERRKRRLAAEPPASSVLSWHEKLLNADYEAAYRVMSSGYQEETNLSEFNTFLDEREDVLVDSSLEVRRVEYFNQSEAEVVADHSIDNGQVAVVRYRLVSPGAGFDNWRIREVQIVSREGKGAEEEGAPAEQEAASPDAGAGDDGDVEPETD